MLIFKEKKKRKEECLEFFVHFSHRKEKNSPMAAANNGRKSKPSVKQWIQIRTGKDVTGYLGKQIARRLDISPKRA